MKLSEIIRDIDCELVFGDTEREITDLVYDSRKVTDGCAFVCLVGAAFDGHSFASAAAACGAVAIIAERELTDIPEGITLIKTQNTRRALALMSAAFFRYPARELITVGLTGTKGKTTTTYMIKSVLEAAGCRIGLIGSAGAFIGDSFIPTKNTTPESYELQKMFRQMADAGCKYAVMEVSSQGLKLDRVAGIEFDYGIFTNLSPDHIGPNEHASLEEYIECKSLLFRRCKTAIVNADDSHTDEVLRGHTCRVLTYSVGASADLTADSCEFINESGRLGMRFHTTGAESGEYTVNSPGIFSVYNALVTVLLCNQLGIDRKSIADGLLSVKVKGRVEAVPFSDGLTVIIDFAHNEVSARSILSTLAEYKPNRIICVFGCGGNRSKLRRYDMGQVAGELADLCVITADNPRDEEVADICADIKVGIARSNGKYVEIHDRREAIRYAITHAEAGDFVVMLGKGHEDYQEVRGVKHHFDEHEVVAELRAEIFPLK